MPAKDLYTSALFTKIRAFVECRNCRWFILSAEHGLMHPDAVIAPYEKTLNTMGVKETDAWTERVIEQMKAKMPESARITLLAGHRYREFLLPYLRERARIIDMPLEGKRIGEQLQWLSQAHDGEN